MYTQGIATQYPHLCRLTSTILDFAKIDCLRSLIIQERKTIFYCKCVQYSMTLRSEQFLWKDTCIVTLIHYGYFTKALMTFFLAHSAFSHTIALYTIVCQWLSVTTQVSFHKNSSNLSVIEYCISLRWKKDLQLKTRPSP